jgi:hypothetical protein
VYGSEGLYREGNPTRQAEEVGGAIGKDLRSERNCSEFGLEGAR